MTKSNEGSGDYENGGYKESERYHDFDLNLKEILSCLRNESKMVKYLGSEFSLIVNSVRHAKVQTCNHLYPRSTNIVKNSIEISSHV